MEAMLNRITAQIKMETKYWYFNNHPYTMRALLALTSH